MLAKNVNDNACFLDERGAFGFFASKLAPTGGGVSVGPLFGKRVFPAPLHRLAVCRARLELLQPRGQVRIGL